MLSSEGLGAGCESHSTEGVPIVTESASIFEPLAEDEFASLLRRFSVDSLELLTIRLQAPRFYRPKFATSGSWRRDCNDPEILRRTPSAPVWDYVFDQTVWPDWDGITLLSSYGAVRQAVLQNLSLRRRIRIAYKLPYEERYLYSMETMSGLDLMLQNYLLRASNRFCGVATSHVVVQNVSSWQRLGSWTTSCGQ